MAGSVLRGSGTTPLNGSLFGQTARLASRRTVRQHTPGVGPSAWADGFTDNLLANASFEWDSNADGLADGWGTFGTPTCSQVTGRTGGLAQRVTVPAGNSWDIRFTPIPIRTPGTPYTLSVYRWVQSLNTSADFVIKIEWLDSTGTLTNYDYSITTTTDTGWTRMTLTTTPNATATQARIICAVEGGGTVDVDDIQLECDSTASAFILPDIDWSAQAIMTTADAPGAGGAIGWYVDKQAIRPYEASFSSMGFAAAYRRYGIKHFADAAWNWCAWYAAHIEADGTMWDYKISSGALVKETSPVPAAPTAAIASTTGGTLSQGLHSYTITGLNTVGGETTASPAGTVTTANATSQVTLTWAIPNLTYGFNIYRDGGLIATVNNTAGTYTDTGAVTPGAAAPSTNTCYFRDSTDSYAGMFLLALKIANIVDPRDLTGYATAIQLAVNGIALTQDSDGLTWAKPEYHAKYLMDQTEAAAGFDSAVSLGTTLGSSTIINSATSGRGAILTGVEALFNTGNAGGPAYDWAVSDIGVHTATYWEDYPQSLQQVWAVAMGMPSSATVRAQGLVQNYQDYELGWANWNATGRYETLAGVALERVGRTPEAQVGTDASLYWSQVNGRAWDWNPMKVAWAYLARWQATDLIPDLPDPPTTTRVTATAAAAWNSAAAVTVSPTAAWNVLSAVSATAAAAWTARASITSATATAWNAAAAVTASPSSAWNIATPVTTTAPAAWNARTAATATIGSTWDAKVAVSTAAAAAWNALATITAAAAAAWNAQSGVTGSTSSTWDVHTTASATAQALWDARGAVTATTGTAWDVRAGVTAGAPTAWNSAGTVTGSSSTSWNTASTVTTTAAAGWTVAVAVTAATAAAWAVTTAASATAPAAWSTDAQVTSTSAASWDVHASATSTAAAAWTTAAAVTAGISTGWTVTAAVTSTVGAAWNTVAQITSTAQVAWDVTGAPGKVSNSAAATWDTRAAVTAAQGTSWDVRTVAAVTGAASWDVRQQASQTATSAWGTRQTATSTADSAWDALQAVTGLQTAAWDITQAVSAVTAAVQASWAVLAAVACTLDTRWHVTGGALVGDVATGSVQVDLPAARVTVNHPRAAIRVDLPHAAATRG